MNKSIQRLLGIAMASLLSLTLIAGCGTPATPAASPSDSAGTTASSVAASSEAPSAATTDPLKLKITTVSFGEEPTGKPVQEAWLKQCSDLMGRPLDVAFEYIHMQDYGEKIKIMLASSELPDMFTSWGLTQEEVVKYGENGQFLELSSRFDQMPNYKKFIDMAPTGLAKIASGTGKIYGLYFVQKNVLALDGGHDIDHSVGINLKVFEENGLTAPTTTEELYTAARKLKEKFPDKYPIFQMEEWQNPINFFYGTNHVGDSRYYDGTAFQYGPLQEGYKDALVEMNRWYKDGLISPDYFTQTQANGNATMAAGEGMIIPSMWYGYPTEFETKYPDQKWAMVTGIRNPKYGDPWTFSTFTKEDVAIYPNWCVVLNASSKAVDKIVKLADIQLSDEVCDLVQWGIKDETYTVDANGGKHYTDAVKKDFTAAQSKYSLGNGACRPAIFPQIQDQKTAIDLAVPQNNIIDGKAMRVPYSQIKREAFNPAQQVPQSTITLAPLTAEESETYANIMTPIDTYAKEQAARFITGSRPLAEWDKYVEELKAMGDIQKAMDIYNGKIMK